MTIRQRILDNIKATLDAIVGVDNVFVNKVQPTDLDTCSFPSAFVFSDEESRTETPYGMETWNWNVVIEAWTKGDSEELLGQIHTAMAVDVTRGGICTDCLRAGVNFFVIDADNDVKGIVMRYLIQYRHPFGTP